MRPSRCLSSLLTAAAATLVLSGLSVTGARAVHAATPSPDASTEVTATQGELLDRIVAIVNDGVVLQSDLDNMTREVTARLRNQGVALPPEKALQSQVLDQLVLERIQAQRAQRAGIKVSDEQVNAALENIAKQQGISFEDLPSRLAADGIDYAAYREELRGEIARDILRNQEVIQHIVITPRELDQYMSNQQNTPSGLYEYEASDILLALPQDAAPDQVSKADALARDIDRRARSGEDFAKLAITYSQAQNALQGGSLGWRKGTELPTYLAEAIARLAPGSISDVIRTPTGFHIVKLDGRRAAGGPQIVQQVHLRHILMKPTELEDDATVRQKLERMRGEILAGKEDFAVLARTNSQDPGSAVRGGDLGWSELSAYVPQFAAVAGSLSVNQISQPFKTPFGWHIVQLLGRRDFDNSKDAARERAYEALRDSRVDEATELWLQQLKDESYVKREL